MPFAPSNRFDSVVTIDIVGSAFSAGTTWLAYTGESTIRASIP